MKRLLIYNVLAIAILFCVVAFAVSAHVSLYPAGWSIVSWDATGDGSGNATAYTDAAPLGQIYKVWTLENAANPPASTVTWNGFQYAINAADTTDLITATSTTPTLESVAVWPTTKTGVFSALKLTASGLLNSAGTAAKASIWIVIGPPDSGGS